MAIKKPAPLLPYSIVKVCGQKPNTVLFTTIPTSHDTVGPHECFCTLCAVDGTGAFSRVIQQYAVPLEDIIDTQAHHDTTPEDNAVIMAALGQLKQLACA